MQLAENSFSTQLLCSCTDEYAHTYDISTYWVSSDRVSSELGLGLGFSLRAARVHTRHIYIHATCKRHVEKWLTATRRQESDANERLVCGAGTARVFHGGMNSILLLRHVCDGGSGRSTRQRRIDDVFQSGCCCCCD